MQHISVWDTWGHGPALLVPPITLPMIKHRLPQQKDTNVPYDAMMEKSSFSPPSNPSSMPPHVATSPNYPILSLLSHICIIRHRRKAGASVCKHKPSSSWIPGTAHMAPQLSASQVLQQNTSAEPHPGHMGPYRAGREHHPMPRAGAQPAGQPELN